MTPIGPSGFTMAGIDSPRRAIFSGQGKVSILGLLLQAGHLEHVSHGESVPRNCYHVIASKVTLHGGTSAPR